MWLPQTLDGTSTTYGVGYAPTAPSEQFKLWTPAQYRRNTRRALIWEHGAGGDYRVGPHEGGFVRRGAALIATDLGGLQPWGSDASLDRIDDAHVFANTRLGCPADIRGDWGGSMGSLTGLLDALENPTKVVAAACALPIVDPEQVRIEDAGGIGAKAAIEAVYGAGTVPTAKRPLERVDEYDPEIPLLLVISENDTVGDAGLAHDFADAHPNCEVISLGSVGHSYLTMDGAAVWEWLRPHLEIP